MIRAAIEAEMWIALIAAASGLSGALIQWWRGRRVDTATATDVISQAAQRLVDALSADNAALRVEIAALRVEVSSLKSEVHRLSMNTGK